MIHWEAQLDKVTISSLILSLIQIPKEGNLIGSAGVSTSLVITICGERYMVQNRAPTGGNKVTHKNSHYELSRHS